MKQISAYECRICRRGSKLWKIKNALTSIAAIRLLARSVWSPSGIDQSCSSGRLGALQVKGSWGERTGRSASALVWWGLSFLWSLLYSFSAFLWRCICRRPSHQDKILVNIVENVSYHIHFICLIQCLAFISGGGDCQISDHTLTLTHFDATPRVQEVKWVIQSLKNNIIPFLHFGLICVVTLCYIMLYRC